MTEMDPDRQETPRGLGLEIFLVSFGALLLEISYTRIFSFKVSSYYTYLILGFALLGIGAGAVFVALSASSRRVRPEVLLPRIALAGSISIVLGYFGVAALELSTFELPTRLPEIARLSAACLVLFGSFLAVGISIALIFAAQPERIHRLYAADLAGAGLGCAAAIPAMVLLTPPGCVLASAAAVLAMGLRPAISSGQRRTAGAVGVFFVLLIGVALRADLLPDPVVDAGKTMGAPEMERWGFESVFHRWHPLFRIDLLESPSLPGRKAIAHDGDWGSAIWEFDGSAERLAERTEATNRALPFAVAKPKPRVLIIGSAGGNEILASLHFEAEHITAVELNPVTISLLTDHYADYTGRLSEHERVTLINAEGRAFLSRDESEYDLIYFVAPDSYATMSTGQASGFVLVESYLYTKEMVAEALGHLSPNGILCMQFGEVDFRKRPNRTTRYLATARTAFAELGIRDFARHVMVSTTAEFPIQLSTMLLTADPFSQAQVESFREVASGVPKTIVRHAPGQDGRRGPLNQVISLPAPQLEEFYERFAYDVRPVSDDAPFFWHFARFRDVLGRGDHPLRDPIGPEDGRGETALLVMLAVSVTFATIFLLLPFVVIRKRWGELPNKVPTAIYFAALGLGFMFYEIALLQKLTLFLGRPTYSLTVTLFALLIFSGIGSLLSERYLERRDRALSSLLVALAVLTVFYQFGLDAAVEVLMGEALSVRIAVTAFVLAPIGLVLGSFMPLGLATVARITPDPGEYVAWAWALNGVFSVVASLLATMVSMSYGFRVLLLTAFATYCVAILALRAVPLRPKT